LIGLDTNILVRYFVKDDPDQTRLAVKLVHELSPEEPGWVGLSALLELVWALTRIYRVRREQLVQILDTLLASQDIVMEQRETVREALLVYRTRHKDFADCLIASSASAAGCVRTLTFDRNAARDGGMELVA
jgi:predicted nucleic-acid-binding protein